MSARRKSSPGSSSAVRSGVVKSGRVPRFIVSSTFYSPRSLRSRGRLRANFLLSQPCPRRGEQLLGVLPRFGGDLRAAEHARDFLASLLGRELPRARARAAPRRRLLDREV